MKRSVKEAFTLFLVFVMCLFTVTGCSSKTPESSTENSVVQSTSDTNKKQSKVLMNRLTYQKSPDSRNNQN